MSTKTTLKRIALVAVSALGFGLLSVAPSQATTQRTVSSLTQGTLPVVRAGVTANIPVTAVFAANAANTDTFTVAAKVISAPAGSAHINNSVNNVNASGGLINITEASDVLGDGTATFTAFTNASGLSDAQVSENIVINGANGTTSGTFRVSFTPDVAGTYQILVSANAATYTAGNPSTVVTVTTAGAPVSVSVSALGRVVEGAPANFGANLAVTLKDAAGLATILGPNEAINVTTSNTTTTSLSASTLSSPTSAGTYVVLVEDGTITANGTAVITFTGSGVLPATLTTNTTVTVVDTTATTAQATLKSATGYAGTAPTYYTAAKSSHTYTFAASVTEDTTYAVVVDASGTGARDYATSVTVPAADDTVDFSVSQALSATGVTSISVGMSNAGTAVASPIVINYEAPVANKIAIEGASSLLLATGGSVKLTASVKDQFGNAFANSAVNVSATGRTTVLSTTLGVTDANGLISYTFKDAGTTGTTNTVSFSATLSTPAGSSVAPTTGSKADVTITYGTVTAAKVTVSGGSKAETVAGSTLTAINAADNGPEASFKSIKAVVTDANGNLLAGVPVTFTVDKGAIVKTAAIDYSVVYTGTDGSASTRVFDWLAGKQTITATVGTASGTDYLTWAATTASSARVLTGKVDGNILSYKVVDRFGNPVNGVAITLSRTGSGLFGNGSSSQTITTDKTGTADASFNGAGTVDAELATSTQAYDVAGEIDATAVTAAVAGTTKGTGASFAPAGVGKVSLAVTAGSDAASTAAAAAADAAAEAIDAANAATDAANLAAEAADAATVAAEEARDAADAATAAVEELATQVATLMAALKAQITTLANTVAKIAKKVRA